MKLQFNWELIWQINESLTFIFIFISDISCKIWDDYESIIIREGLTIDTLKGRMKADIGEYIIKGVNGGFYPCKPDIFAKTYEEITE